MSAVHELDRYCSARERQMHFGELHEPDPGVEQRVVSALDAVGADVSAVCEVAETMLGEDLTRQLQLAGPFHDTIERQGRDRLAALRKGGLSQIVREMAIAVGPVGLVEAVRPLLYPEQALTLRM